MSPAPNMLAHHSEVVDPTLIEWIRHQIDQIVGLDGDVIAVLLGILIVLFPVVLIALAWRQRRRATRIRKG